jgi:hypothetical protein
VGLIWKRDQSIIETSTCTAHYMYKTQTSMPMYLVGFEPSIPVSQRTQTYNLDHAITTTENFICRLDLFLPLHLLLLFSKYVSFIKLSSKRFLIMAIKRLIR